MASLDSNPLSLNNFEATFSLLNADGISIRQFAYNVTSISLPDITTSSVAIPYKTGTTFVPGDKVEFGELSLTFLSDEGLDAYMNIRKWILDNVRKEVALYAEITIHVLNSSNNPSHRVQLTSAFPLSISGATFNAQNTDEEYATFDVTFRYDEMTIL